MQRYEQGMQKLEEIDGEAALRVIDSLKDVSADLAKYIIEFPFGEVPPKVGKSRFLT